MFVVPISNSTRRLNIGTDTASKVVPVVKNCGWKPSGLPSEQYTRVPFASAVEQDRAKVAISVACSNGFERAKRWSDMVSSGALARATARSDALMLAGPEAEGNRCA